MLHFVCIDTLEPNCWAFSQYLKTPYWSTARVCCWPPQWERRMKGWLPEYALCALCSGWIWINTVHLSYTPSSFPLLTDYLIGSLLPLSIIARICHQLIAIFFFTQAVERVSDWLRWQEGGSSSRTDPKMQDIAACQSLSACAYVWLFMWLCVWLCVCLMRLWSDIRPCLNRVWGTINLFLFPFLLWVKYDLTKHYYFLYVLIKCLLIEDR